MEAFHRKCPLMEEGKYIAFLWKRKVICRIILVMLKKIIKTTVKKNFESCR